MATSMNEQTLRAAADWWLRLRDPAATERVTEQWLDWIDADPGHLDAFERVTGMAARLGVLDTLTRERLVAEFAPPRSVLRRWLPLAAAAAAVLAVAGLLGWNLLVSGQRVVQEYASAVAGQRSVALADGTRVVLGGATLLRVHFDRGRRQIELLAGEAYFDVAHDAGRPFVVDAGQLAIQDVGTAFDVRRTGARVTVAMARGRVRLDDVGGTLRPLDLVAGQAATFDPADPMIRVTAINPADAASWREARLAFDDEPLSVVVANINRYRAQPVRIGADDLAAMTFTGTVRTDAIDDWLRALPQALPVRVEHAGGQTVLTDARR